MSWLNDTENYRRRQVAMMAKAFGDNDIQKAAVNDVSEEEEKKPKKKAKPNSGKSDMYKMKMLGLRKFNEQDQKEYIGVEDAVNSYIVNHENGDIIISKTTDGYLVSKFPIDAENEEGEEMEAATLSEAIDVALQYKDDLDNVKAPEQIMYKETEDSDDDEYEEDDDDSEKGFDDEINPFERAAWEAEQDEIRKAYETLGLDYDDIEKAKHQDGDMHPNGKRIWRQSANGGKGDWRVANPKRGGGAKKTAAPAASSTTSTTVAPTTSTMSETKKIGVAEIANMLIETARKNKKNVDLSVDVNGKSYTITASDTLIMVRNDAGKVVKSSSPVYSDVMQEAYNKAKTASVNTKTQKQDDNQPAAKTTSVTKEQLDGAADGSEIKITNAQTKNNVISFTKKNGKWYSKNTMTRGEVEASTNQITMLVDKYNRKTYNTEVNLSGVKKTAAAASTTTSTTQKQDDNQPAAKKKTAAAVKKYESDEADTYDKGDGKIGNYPVPTHTSYPALNLYNRLHNNRHFGFKYGMPSDEIMEKLKNYKGNVAVSYHNNAGTLQIYRIKFL